MQIQAVKPGYQYNLNINSQNFKEKNNSSRPINNTFKGISSNGNFQKIKNYMLILATTLYLLMSAQGCKKEPAGPHPTGYQPSEIQSNNSNYPDASPEVMDEFIAWYQENCPVWNWPDYEGPFPDNWSELREQFQQDIENWWHEHGYPDWHTGG